jgi:hypothetical protein
VDEYQTTTDEVRAFCLKLGEARARLRTLAYREGINRQYVLGKEAELDGIQRDFESQIERQ